MSQSVHLCGLVPVEEYKRDKNPVLTKIFPKFNQVMKRAPNPLPVNESCAHTRVGVQVVSQKSDRSEGTAAQVTLVGPFVRMALHVAVQVGAAGAGVAAQFALECLLHTCTSENKEGVRFELDSSLLMNGPSQYMTEGRGSYFS